MTTVQITLPDEPAQKAASERLLSTEAIEAMLRERLRRGAGDAQQAMIAITAPVGRAWT